MEDATAFLMTQEGGADTSLYAHISDVLAKIISEKPENAVEAFEQLSAAVKAERIQSQAPGEEIDPFFPMTSDLSASPEWVAKIQALIAPAAGEDEAPRAVAVPSDEMQDVVDAASVLAWGGIELSTEEAYGLTIAMAALASSEGNDDVVVNRVWGKIQGLTADYVIVEATASSPTDEANEKVYFASTNGTNFTRLPEYTAAHVAVSRQIRRFFTGDLGATVSSYPKFDGTEAHFLRATIARINADCAIAPKGSFVEEDGAKVLPEEAPVLSLSDLMSPSGWEYVERPLNADGAIEPVMTTDEEGAEVENPNRAPALRAVGEDDISLRLSSNLLVGYSKALVVVRSTKWDGATTVASGAGRTVSFYLGRGLELTTTTYTPPPPPQPQAEYASAGLVEQSDITEAPVADEAAE